MMKKKFVVSLLTCLLASTILSGCDNKNSNSTSNLPTNVEEAVSNLSKVLDDLSKKVNNNELLTNDDILNLHSASQHLDMLVKEKDSLSLFNASMMSDLINVTSALNNQLMAQGEENKEIINIMDETIKSISSSIARIDNEISSLDETLQNNYKELKNMISVLNNDISSLQSKIDEILSYINDVVDVKGKVSISADYSKIVIELNNYQNDKGDGKYNIVKVRSNEYLKGDPIVGVSTDIVKGEVVGNFNAGGFDRIYVDRYDVSVDNLYSKYYITDTQGNYVDGPFYPTDILGLNTYQEIQPRSKKGITLDRNLFDEVEDLGVSYSSINITITSDVMPNELDPNEYPDHTHVKLDYEFEIEKYYRFQYNGQYYYFPKATIDSYDTQVLELTKRNIEPVLIVYGLAGDVDYPYYLRYPGTYNDPNSTAHLSAANTSNDLGADYYAACMEFLAERYSRRPSDPRGYYGNAKRFVIGNEIDIMSEWNAIVPTSAPRPSIETYMEEYNRTMRIANLAVKKYYSGNKVLMSLAHYWADTTRNTSHYAAQSYPGKECFDYLQKFSEAQGSYDWGLAHHPHPYDMTSPNFWTADTLHAPGDEQYASGITDNYNTSSIITLSNLDVLDDYLHLEENRYTKENAVRDVYLTEQGVSARTAHEVSKQEYQAAGVAFAYYKAVSLDSVKAFIYYRLEDSPSEWLTKQQFGLLNVNKGTKKIAYDVYKYIDTQYSEMVATPFLYKVSYTTLDGVTHKGFNSYVDAIQMFDKEKKLDWNLVAPRYTFEPFDPTNNEKLTYYRLEAEGSDTWVTFNYFDKAYASKFLVNGEEKSLNKLDKYTEITISGDTQLVFVAPTTACPGIIGYDAEITQGKNEVTGDYEYRLTIKYDDIKSHTTGFRFTVTINGYKYRLKVLPQ